MQIFCLGQQEICNHIFIALPLKPCLVSIQSLRFRRSRVIGSGEFFFIRKSLHSINIEASLPAGGWKLILQKGSLAGGTYPLPWKGRAIEDGRMHCRYSPEKYCSGKNARLMIAGVAPLRKGEESDAGDSHSSKKMDCFIEFLISGRRNQFIGWKEGSVDHLWDRSHWQK